MTEAAAGDHGDADAGDACGCRRGEARGGEDRGDQQGGLVADTARGVLVDCEGVEGGGVEGFAGVAHGLGEGGELAGVEAAKEDGHEEGGDLGVGNSVRDELVFWSAIDYGTDEGLDLSVGEGEAVALVEDDVDGADGRLDGLGHLLRRKAAGRRSAMVARLKAPSAAGK